MLGNAWTGKNNPEINIRGKEIIKENNTAMPSFFEIRPIMKPRSELTTAMARINSTIAQKLNAYPAPEIKKIKKIIRN